MNCLRSITRMNIAKVLSLVGYVIWAWQWLWVAFLYIRSFFGSRIGKWFFPDGQAKIPPAPHTAPLEFSPLALKIAVTLIVVMLVLFVVATVRLYIRGVQQTAATVVHETSGKITPVIVRHRRHRVTKTEERRINQQIVHWVKIALSLLPLAVVAVVPGIDPVVPRGAALLGAAFLALLSVSIFMLHTMFIATHRSSLK